VDGGGVEGVSRTFDPAPIFAHRHTRGGGQKISRNYMTIWVTMVFVMFLVCFVKIKIHCKKL